MLYSLRDRDSVSEGTCTYEQRLTGRFVLDSLSEAYSTYAKVERRFAGEKTNSVI